ncbi:MAG: hypothetical protein JWO89_3533 [Verrucomicrobiaceae bacterium]|nr:hypothetical protein [Verrucomicrobiaceae bacterium]MDB6118989.1 hypothetical protein [Verrucomicrobiaceae bacterium]
MRLVLSGLWPCCPLKEEKDRHDGGDRSTLWFTFAVPAFFAVKSSASDKFISSPKKMVKLV